MRKTSVYLEDAQVERLRQVAEREGRSQAEVLRDAISAYAERTGRPRDFSLARIAKAVRSAREPEGSIADVPEAELMKAFGWDSLSPEQQRRFTAQDRRRTRAGHALNAIRDS